MAPSSSSQKGTTAKKNGSTMQKQSRNPTPVPAQASSGLPPQEFYDPDFLNTRVTLFRDLTIEDLIDAGAASAAAPDSRSLEAMIDKLRTLSTLMEKRNNFYDRGMRYLAEEKKKRPDSFDRPKADGDGDNKRSKHKRKKGPDSLAPQDGGAERSSPLRDSRRKQSRERETGSSSLSPPAAPGSPSAMEVDEKSRKDEKEEDEEEEESSSEDEGPPRRKELPQAQTFGEDPSTFPDPTIYEIRPVYPDMSEQEKREIYSVARYPPSDLADRIAGDPPDRDFSNAKPSSQINFTTFATYIEPFFRHFTEEDLAFLRERGEHSQPFVMPKRGKRHYTELWAEEDGSMSIDSPQQGRAKMPPNQPRGNIEGMNDTIGETDSLSIGPLTSRLLQALRPEHRVQAEEKPSTNGLSNGDISMNGDLNGDERNGAAEDKSNSPLPPAAYIPDSSTEAWRKATHPKLEYHQMEERIKQELRHIGFLPQENVEADYDAHYDDEVAARLRTLQDRLREQMLINGARKARLTDLVRERMAHQEYQTILEDLDSQVQAAYLKRTRTMGKSKKAKRPGGAGGGSHAVAGSGMARPGIGDMTKTLMERRRRWIDTIGSVFDDENLCKVPRVSDPESSIFKPSEMAELIKKEKEQLDDEVDEE